MTARLLHGPAAFRPSPHPLPAGAASRLLDLHTLATDLRGRECDLDIAYPYLAGAVLARKLAHHAGRACAHEALLSLTTKRLSTTGDTGITVTIARGIAGEPIWPLGTVGSITHTGDYACAVAARRLDCVGIGIDSDAVVNEATCDAVFAVCLSSAERERFLRGAPTRRCLDATAIFCIKEAFYKAAYPLVCRFIEFDELEVRELNVDTGHVVLRTTVLEPLPDLRLRARICRTGDQMHACVSLHSSLQTNTEYRSRHPE